MSLRCIVIFLTLLIISGCEKGTVNKLPSGDENKNKSMLTQKEMEGKKINPVLFKGIFYRTNETAFFTDCISKKKYMLAPSGENAEIEKAYENFPLKNDKTGMYSEIEGFISEQSNSRGKGMDTVFVITRFIMADSLKKCN